MDSKNFYKRFKSEKYPEAYKALLNLLKHDFNKHYKILLKHSEYKYFWESDIPMDLFEEIFTSDKAESILFNYFNQRRIKKERKKGKLRLSYPPAQKSVQTSLLTKLSETYSGLLMETIRHSEVFLKDEHFASFSFFKFHPDKQLQDFYAFLDYFHHRNKQFLARLAKYDGRLKKVSLLELLTMLSLVPEEIRYNYYKDGLITAYRIVEAGDGISIVLNRKRGLGNMSIPTVQKIDDLYTQSYQYIFNVGKMSSEDNWIRELSFIAIEYSGFRKNLLGSFCYDVDYNRVLRSDKTLEISPNNPTVLSNWIKNGLKYKFWEKYYNTKGAMDTELLVQEGKLGFPGETPKDVAENRYAFSKSVGNKQRIEDFGIPDRLKVKGKGELSVYLLFEMLEGYAANCRDRYENFINGLYLGETNESFLKGIQKTIRNNVFKHKILDGPLRPYSYDEYLEISKKTFRQQLDLEAISEEDLKSAIDFLTFDLNNPFEKLDIFRYPFIRCGEVLFAFPHIVSNQDFFVAIVNRLIDTKGRKKERKEETDLMDEQLAGFFDMHDFKTATGLKLYKDNKEYTDIDVLAYKDKTLFVLQNKSTHVRMGLKEAHNNRTLALEKAAEQLKKSISYINEKFEEFQQKLSFHESKEEVKIYPLIVSTSFEDDYSFFDGFKKTTFFELKVILHNTNFFMGISRYLEVKKLEKRVGDDPYVQRMLAGLDNPESVEELLNEAMGFDEITLQNKMEKELLYRKPLTSERLIEIIENDEVWKGLDNLIELPDTRGRIEIPLDGSSLQKQNQLFLDGNTAFNAGYYKKALEKYNAAIVLCPDEYENYKGKGNALAMLGKTKASIEAFNKAIKLNPYFARAYYDRSISHHEMGNLSETLKDINKAIEIEPYHAEFFLSRGKLYIEFARKYRNISSFVNAKQDLEKALEIPSEHHIYHEATQLLKVVKMALGLA